MVCLDANNPAIGMCFQMTTVFRSDVLANAMQRIADLPALPMIFMRTIIQAVTTYKSLGAFVANYVLPKLIAKKIWTNPQLWDGFIRLARRIAPASFGALVQLPKEWLRDVVEKQPALKQGLKGFLSGKPGTKEVLVEVSACLTRPWISCSYFRSLVRRSNHPFVNCRR
jgi:symplekin